MLSEIQENTQTFLVLKFNIGCHACKSLHAPQAQFFVCKRIEEDTEKNFVRNKEFRAEGLKTLAHDNLQLKW